MSGLNDYYNTIGQPWGRIMYDLLYRQLVLPDAPRLKILDFGSGFGVCADHYAAHHCVTAIEPNREMVDMRFRENEYKQIVGGMDALAEFKNEFDLALCHNVVEYVPEQEAVFKALARALKPGGRLSIIKHNPHGRAMAAAVFEMNPQKALDLLLENKDVPHYFGDRRLYTNEEARAWAENFGLSLAEVFGIRTFFALVQNNEIKYDPAWYEKMLGLEEIAGRIDEYKAVAFYNHLLFRKKDA